MAYSKHTWLPRLGTGLNKFHNTGDAENLELTPNPDSITQEGTPFSAPWMNEMEDGIANAHDDITKLRRYTGAAGLTVFPTQIVKSGDVCGETCDNRFVYRYNAGDVIRSYSSGEFVNPEAAGSRLHSEKIVFLNDELGVIVGAQYIKTFTRNSFGSISFNDFQEGLIEYNPTTVDNWLPYCDDVIKIQDNVVIILYDKTDGSMAVRSATVNPSSHEITLGNEITVVTGSPEQRFSGSLVAIDEKYFIVAAPYLTNGDEFVRIEKYKITSGYLNYLGGCAIIDFDSYLDVRLFKVNYSEVAMFSWGGDRVIRAALIDVSQNTPSSTFSTTIISGSLNFEAMDVVKLDSCYLVTCYKRPGGNLSFIRVFIENDTITCNLPEVSIYSWATDRDNQFELRACRINGKHAAVCVCDSINGTNTTAIYVFSAEKVEYPASSTYVNLNSKCLSPSITVDNTHFPYRSTDIACYKNELYAQQQDTSIKQMHVILPEFIVLNDASYGEMVEAVYDGNAEIDGLKADTTISSPGVSGYVFADGKIHVKGWWNTI